MTFMPQSKHLKKMVSFSRGLDENLIQHSLNEKKSLKLTSKVITYLLYYFLRKPIGTCTSVEYVKYGSMERIRKDILFF